MASRGIPSPLPPSSESGSESQAQAAPIQYWCHQCHKQVSVHTLFNRQQDLVCLQCNNGLVESIPPDDSPQSPEAPTFNRGFLHLLRSISQAANNQDPSIDYVDVVEYESVLQNLTESDEGSRFGPPPAARSAVVTLPTVEIKGRENLVCAVCKEGVLVGERAKKLPCEHIFHVDCIIPWLEMRNTCPTCRFELPTNNEEYEKTRKGRR